MLVMLALAPGAPPGGGTPGPVHPRPVPGQVGPVLRCCATTVRQPLGPAADVAAALVHLLERSKLVVEPAGAVGVAALLAGRMADLGFELGTTAVILSGGNIDPMLMLKSIQAGLSAAGRYMTVRIPLRDRPGELATISRIIADTDANVVRVDHTRVGPELSMGGVHITIDMETRGAEHTELTLGALRGAGFEPLVVAD